MADETYRPRKKSVDPSDVSQNPPNTPETNKAQLDAMAEMRAALGREVGNESSEAQLQGNENLQVSGKMPEQLKSAIRDRPATPSFSDAPMRVTGSSKLEELVGGISQSAAWEPIQLPSKGKFYNGEDGPQDGVIHLRPMTGEEEQILATPRFVKKGQAIDMIFNRCMQESYDSSNFLTQDRTYMLIYLRGISYTPEYEVEVRDPESDQQFTTSIDLNSLYLDHCPLDFDESKLSGVLPTTGYKFKYRLARGTDEKIIQTYRERRAKNFDTSGQADDTLLYRTAILLEEIEGLTDKDELQYLLKKLPINDVAYLRTTVTEPPFGVDTTVTITSPYTLQDFDIELPLEASFFFPRAKRESPITT